ncbi:Arogenate dehydrogenase [Slackia heliotrinireducens]|nr:prephenate dehydrogenase/arogenate dehydrogenase family protein [Slackia heliotrinireducens]VEH00006.1 Arogenate dehydrogenase [Slackia heliotrinireducens]
MAETEEHGVDAILANGKPRKVGIAGLGLIGGSFAKSYSEAGCTVYGWNRTESTLAAAINERSVSAKLDETNIGECDCILVALYPQVTIDWVTQMAPYIEPGTLVIDCGGVKRVICEPLFELAEQHGFVFMGGHPMAGTQYSGFRYAKFDLYAGEPFVLVPPAIYDPRIIQAAELALAPCGFGTFSVTTPEKHDELIAYTSQLAHVVSSAFIKSPTALKHRGFSAGSYKDLTRVAEMNAAMWTELFLDNADNLTTEIDRVICELERYRDAITDGDSEHLQELLQAGTDAKAKADGRWPDRSRSS